MRAHSVGHVLGLAAPEVASSSCAAGDASVDTDAVAPGVLTTAKGITTEECDAPAGQTINDLDLPTAQRGDQAFTALRTAYAMRGHDLHRTADTDGATTYWAARWGLVRYLPTIDAARRFLEQIGGRL